MTAEYALGGRAVRGTADSDAFVFLANRVGDVLSFPSRAASKYHGWFIRDRGECHKLIDRVEVEDGVLSPSGIQIFKDRARRVSLGVSETAALPEAAHVMEVRYSRRVRITPWFDIRPLFRFPDWGRAHEVRDEGGATTIAGGFGDFRIAVAIVSDRGTAARREEWRRVLYDLDRRRQSSPDSRYLCAPAVFEGRRFVFAADRDSKNAARLALRFARKGSFPRRAPPPLFLAAPRVRSNAYGVAACAARRALAALYLPRESMFRAGLPWFSSSWARDTLLSIPEFSPSFRARIIAPLWERAREEGRLMNVSGSSLASADAMGWLLLRMHELPSRHRTLVDAHWKSSFRKIMRRWEAESVRDGLLMNGPHETWMDSILREGARIELQALFLRALRFAAEVLGDASWRDKEARMRLEVRRHFWDGAVLADGRGDRTIRPNLFLAAYAYPDLLSRAEWQKCFKNTLRALWLPWGGISSIDTHDMRFHSLATGENPASYHQGDSWLYLNNIAGFLMRTIGGRAFFPYARRILQASAKEILFYGALGAHGELSSASRLESVGAWSQAWSNSSFLEFLRGFRI